MSNAVFVVGAGVISAIGNNVAENLHALETGTAGMNKMTLLDSIHKETLPVAEVKLSNEQLSSITGLPTKITRTALLSLVAAKEAINNAAINTKGLRTGFISANSVGGMDKTENFYAEFRSNQNTGKLRNVVNHECGRPTEIVADALGIKNYVTTISTACSSSANAIFLGARMIKNNMLDVVIAGGVDALTKFTLNGFNSLMILDNEFCQPFDENRKGLNLGEGAGYIVMVSEKVAKTLSSKIYCTLSGWCNANIRLRVAHQSARETLAASLPFQTS